MTLNLGYGIGISPKQRHKRHQRHYRHARTLPGVWGTPQKCACGWPHAMLAKHVPAQNDDNQTQYPYKFVYSSRMNQFGFIQKSWLEKVNPFWFTREKNWRNNGVESQKSIIKRKSTAGISKNSAGCVKQNRPNVKMKFWYAVKLHKSAKAILCIQLKHLWQKTDKW